MTAHGALLRCAVASAVTLGGHPLDAAPTPASDAPPRELAAFAHLAIYGHLTTPDGTPAAGATVVATPDKQYEQHIAVADERGDYWLVFVPAGTAALSMSYAGQTIGGNDVWVDDREAARYDAVLPEPSPFPRPPRPAVANHGRLTIYGHLVDRRGEPAMQATVVATSPALQGEEVVLSDEHGTTTSRTCRAARTR